MVDFRKKEVAPVENKATAIADSFFVMALLDDRPQCRWVKTYGKRKGIDGVHDWCITNLKLDDVRWMSMLSHDRDAVILDVHFFDEETYQKFFRHFERFYLPDEEEENG